jgi:hypothetical protein
LKLPAFGYPYGDRVQIWQKSSIPTLDPDFLEIFNWLGRIPSALASQPEALSFDAAKVQQQQIWKDSSRRAKPLCFNFD